MDFGGALAALKRGERVMRSGWNGKGMWIVLVAQPTADASAYGGVSHHVWGARVLPWIGMKTADNGWVPWLASQTDVLAEDWEILT